MSSQWQKELPTEDGWYWYREAGETPVIVELEADTKSITECGSEIGKGGNWSRPIAGEFRLPKIVVPDSA